MPLTWTDFANGESALSIRNKLNTFNNATVTEVATVTSASNANNTAIATNTADIATNATNIATNTSDIAALDTRVGSVEATLAAGINDFVTLIGNYPTPVTYNLTTAYQNVANYSSSGNSGFTVSEVNGTFSPSHTGFYRISSFMSGTTAENSQKISTVAFVEDGVVLFEGSTTFISDTGLNRSFTAIFPLTAGKVYKLQIKANASSSVAMKALNFSANYVGS
jgi:hypothetical protein